MVSRVWGGRRAAHGARTTAGQTGTCTLASSFPVRGTVRSWPSARQKRQPGVSRSAQSSHSAGGRGPGRATNCVSAPLLLLLQLLVVAVVVEEESCKTSTAAHLHR